MVLLHDKKPLSGGSYSMIKTSSGWVPLHDKNLVLVGPTP